MSLIKDAVGKMDVAGDKLEQVKTSLDLLDKLATLKLEELIGKVNRQLEDPVKFKITHNDYTKSGTHVTTTDDPASITKALDGIVDGFCAGSSQGTKEAVKGIVGSALGVLLGAGAGQEIYEMSYAAIAEDDILKRIDVAYWSYGVAAKGITDKSQTAIAYVCFKSYIDPNDVHKTELVSMYRAAARLAGEKHAGEILDALAEATKVLSAMQEDPHKALDMHVAALTARLNVC